MRARRFDAALGFGVFRRTLSVFVICAFAQTPVHAAFHLWQVTEAYTNADGSVQFVEMFDSSSGENFVGNLQLQATSDGATKTYTFPSSIPFDESTFNKYLLIATPGFAALPGGVIPDYFLPDPATNGPFFDPHATDISILFTGSFNSIATDPTHSMPVDGHNSLMQSPVDFTLSIGVNSPTNLDGAAGSVDLSASLSGDYNGSRAVDAADYVQWRKSPAVNGGDPAGYNAWRANFGAGSGSGTSAATVPEPTGVTIAFIVVALFGAKLLRTNTCGRNTSSLA